MTSVDWPTIRSCAVVIASGGRQLRAVHTQGAYACRADGRTGSVSRGSPSLHADLFAVYTVDPESAPERRPKVLLLDNLFFAGITRRKCPLCGVVYFEREPIRRLRSHQLRDSTGSLAAPGVWPQRLRHRGVREPGIAPDDLRPTLVDTPGKSGAIAHTQGTEYFVVPLVSVSDFVGFGAVGLDPARRAWSDWTEPLLRNWKVETREDDFGEPFVRMVSTQLGARLDSLRRSGTVASMSIRGAQHQACPQCWWSPTS